MDGYVLIKVSDNGCGIKGSDKNKVLALYRRLQTDVEGTGVGMAIVVRNVDQMVGRLR